MPIIERITVSLYERVQNRIAELQRPGWEWVKENPCTPNTMCAVLDYQVGYENHAREVFHCDEIDIMDRWLANYSDGKWTSIVEFNDAEDGAETVNDLIVVLEKFAAEL